MKFVAKLAVKIASALPSVGSELDGIYPESAHKPGRDSAENPILIITSLINCAFFLYIYAGKINEPAIVSPGL